MKPFVSVAEPHDDVLGKELTLDTFSQGVEKKLGVCAHSFHMIRVLLCCLRGLAKR